MHRLGRLWNGCIPLWVCLFACLSCGGTGDSDLPVRRSKMREIKLSTDRMMVTLQNESLEGVEKDAQNIRKALGEVIGLYSLKHKTKYQTYSREAQTMATAVVSQAKANDVKSANQKFRELVPY